MKRYSWRDTLTVSLVSLKRQDRQGKVEQVVQECRLIAEKQQKEVRAQGRKSVIHVGWREKQREVDEAARKLKEEEKSKEKQHRSEQTAYLKQMLAKKKGLDLFVCCSCHVVCLRPTCESQPRPSFPCF